MTVTDTFTAAPVEDQADFADGSSRGSKLKIIIGGVVGVAVLGAGAMFMFGSGGSSDDSEFRLNPIVTTAQPGASASPSSPAAAPVVKVGSRDPFKPLSAAAVAASAAAESATSTSSSGVSAPAAANPVPSASPVVAPASSITLSVTSIDPIAQTAVVDVDGKKYATGIGKTFAQYFSVYSVFNAQCVGILYGTQSTPVCISQPATVSP